MPETPADRAIREEGERLRKAFPTVDFDHPGARASRFKGERWYGRTRRGAYICEKEADQERSIDEAEAYQGRTRI
jgi:hypothetical protein